MGNLIQIIKAWAKVAYNWLKHFFKIVWGVIQSYWPKIKAFIKEWLVEYFEVIILDGRESGGNEMIEALTTTCPIEIDDIYGLVTLGITADKSIAKVTDLEAETQYQDQYDTMSHGSNGILRING